MNRVREAFSKGPIFVPFLTAGYPDSETFIDLVVLLAEEGAGLIEIGLPFSDPVADGKVIQVASQKVLDAGMNVYKAFELIQQIRERTDVPIAVMTYYNIVMHKGVKSFVKQCVDHGVDGLIVPDLIVEEADELIKELRNQLALTFFLCPTTPEHRVATIVKKTSGFLYYVSRMGVTGVGGLDFQKIKDRLTTIKEQTDIPVALGFGISQPKEAKEFASYVDGIIMGSALIQKIDAVRDEEDFFKYVREFVRPFIW